MTQTKLKNPNTNPWYVLMTLQGEQSEKFDFELAQKNLETWNLWAIGSMMDDERQSVSRRSGWQLLTTWDQAGFRRKLTESLQAEMARRNGDDFDFPGLPSPNDPIDMTRLKFTAPLRMNKYIFPKAVDFFESEFHSSVGVKNACFIEIAKFQRCEFFKVAIFSDVSFDGPAEFLGAIFRGSFFATSAEFNAFSNFSEADFFGAAEFSDVTFAGVAHFKEATFQGKSEKTADTIDFSDASFEKPVNFRKARFFYRYPKFAGTVFHDNSNFSADDEYWPSLETAEPVNAKEFCARVRILLAKQGFSEEEHQFFRREMAFSGRLGDWWRRLPYRVFGAISNYGESIARPIVCLAVLWLLPMLMLSSYFSWLKVMGTTEWNGWHAAGLSFSNIFTFFGFYRVYFDLEMVRQLPGFLQLVGVLQTVLALPLLFFLGLGLRTRFRLR